MTASLVLVHGAWADGSSWQGVIPALQNAGHQVTAVQLPLTTLADDVALTRQIIGTLPAPVILVGHSYGGAVISGAAAGLAQVASLVFVAAYAPDAGETILDINGKFPATAGVGAIRPSFQPDVLILDAAQLPTVFAGDLDPVQARVLAAVQKPVHGACFGTPAASAAWHTLPSWYIVADNDQTINPAAEQWMAERMGAQITHLPTSHVAMLAQPAAVAEVILAAGAAVGAAS